MIIFPAINLRNGMIVKHAESDTSITTEPSQIARQWAEQGAGWLHVINLDGEVHANQEQIRQIGRPSNIVIQRPGTQGYVAKYPPAIERLPVNLQKLYEIRKAVTLPIQFGGGLRTLDDIEMAFALGVNRVILGTLAVEEPELVSAAIKRWGAEKILISVDAKDGMAVTHGRQKTSQVRAVDLGHHMHALGIRRVIYSDIFRDGRLCGVDAEAISRLGDTTDLRVIAKGGVSSIQDVELFKSYEHYNVEGVIIGTALYSGAVDLPQAIEVSQRPLSRESAGLVPFRKTCNGPEFLLLFNLFLEQWQFPRGGMRGNEVKTQCAVREFIEETGMGIVHLFLECRTTLEYTSSIREYEIDRTITYFLAEIKPSEIRLGNENHCEARWLPYQDAWELLTETSPEQLPALDGAMAFLSQNRQRATLP